MLIFNGLEKPCRIPWKPRLKFFTEWKAVKSEDVYRRIIADDGKGMIVDEVRKFLTRLGRWKDYWNKA